jgi:hypothetical protein
MASVYSPAHETGNQVGASIGILKEARQSAQNLTLEHCGNNSELQIHDMSRESMEINEIASSTPCHVLEVQCRNSFRSGAYLKKAIN